MSNEPIVTTVYPPIVREHGVSACPYCINGRMPDGMSSYRGMPDGSIVVAHQEGSVCEFCEGSGLVRITAYKPAEQKGERDE